MSVLLLASATLALLAPPSITVNVKEGDALHGERAFRVRATTDTAIGKVEFYVNNELRDTDESTPYEFKLDTVSEADGPLKLRFKATTVENKVAEKTISITVDNEVAKGAPYHVAKANDLLTDSKFADARDEGRIAMKADKTNLDARFVLARAYIGLGEYDKAQLQAEEAKAAKPNDPAALTLLAGINVRRAFKIGAKPGEDRATTMKEIKDALASAATDRNAALAATLDTLKPEGAGLVPYADAAIRAGRYQVAVKALAPAFDKDQKNVALANRLSYAYLRLDRLQEATNVQGTLQRASGSLDAYGLALRAVILADQGNDAGSDAAIKDAILGDSENIGVQTAQAFIALKRNKTDVLSRLATDLGKEQGSRTDVRYFLMALAAKQQRYGDADKAFQAGILAEPAMADLYIEYANGAIGLTQRATMDAKEKANHYAEARAYFETALVARPEASEALSGLSMVALFESKPAEAVRYAQAAVAAAPNDAGAYYALAAAQAVARDPQAQASNLKAGQLDPKSLKGRSTPDVWSVWHYLDTAGRPTVIAAPSA